MSKSPDRDLSQASNDIGIEEIGQRIDRRRKWSTSALSKLEVDDCELRKRLSDGGQACKNGDELLIYTDPQESWLVRLAWAQ
jgi:hypothetical protein